MTIAETIYQHVKTMPLAKAVEVLHFVEFLETKPDVIAKDTPKPKMIFLTQRIYGKTATLARNPSVPKHGVNPVNSH